MNNGYFVPAIIIFIICCLNIIVRAQEDYSKDQKSDWEVLPILNYDSDVGFGYGIKGFFYDQFNHNESFDITLYNSTKGERWYQLAYSVPDRQRRQGKKYDLAFDLTVDYDKWINYQFYRDNFDPGLLNRNKTLAGEFEKYIREPVEVNAIFSRAFTKDFIAELGISFKSVSCYNFESDGILKNLIPSSVKHISFMFNFGLDTRIDFNNPSEGIVLKINNKIARDVSNNNESYFELSLRFQSYVEIFVPQLIFASRVILETQTETSYQNHLSLGGNSSLRGIPQDRHLSSSLLLWNSELRIQLWWRIGGIVGVDIGNSSSTPQWIINPVIGLRLIMDNFVARVDLGIGKESAGFYLNFGHLF
jgi:hypothetical protein